MAEKARYTRKEKSLFGKIFFKHRRAVNMSIKEFADRAGRKIPYVRWLEVKDDPSFNDIRIIERIFDLEPGTLFFEYMAELTKAARAKQKE